MTVLCIFLFLLLLVFAVLFADISLVFVYKDEFNFKIKLGCFSISGKKIIDIIESREKNKDNSQVNTEETHQIKKQRKKKSPSDIVDLVSYITDLIKAILGQFCKYAKLKLCRVKISIATEDAAETALIYGAASSALYTALEFFDSFITIKKNYKNIGIAPDFSSEECRIDLKVILKVKIIHLLLAFIGISPVLASAKKGK